MQRLLVYPTNVPPQHHNTPTTQRAFLFQVSHAPSAVVVCVDDGGWWWDYYNRAFEEELTPHQRTDVMHAIDNFLHAQKQQPNRAGLKQLEEAPIPTGDAIRTIELPPTPPATYTPHPLPLHYPCAFPYHTDRSWPR